MKNIGEFIVDELTLQNLRKIAIQQEETHDLVSAADIDPHSFTSFLEYMGMEDDPDAQELLEEATIIENKKKCISKKEFRKIPEDA